jgi:transcriptional regulator with XRE-family HTH domain
VDEPQQVIRGRLLKAARIKVNLDQAEAARLLGIHRVSLSRIERGVQKKVSSELYTAMERLYGMENEEVAEVGATFIPNPAFKKRLRPAPYTRVYEHIDQMERAGCSLEQIEEAERLMIDAAYNKLNAWDLKDRSDAEMILDIDAAWSWIKEVLQRTGAVKEL